MRWLDGITDLMDVSPSVRPSSQSKLQELVMDFFFFFFGDGCFGSVEFEVTGIE